MRQVDSVLDDERLLEITQDAWNRLCKKSKTRSSMLCLFILSERSNKNPMAGATASSHSFLAPRSKLVSLRFPQREFEGTANAQVSRV